MLRRTQFHFYASSSLVMLMTLGCYSGPPRFALNQSQLRPQQLYQQNGHGDGTRWSGRHHQPIGGGQSNLEQQYLSAKQSLDRPNARLDNLASSNSQMEEKMRTLLTGNKGGNNPLSPDSNRRLEELPKKYKDFDFDPQTGVSKFSTDLLFASGSDELQPKAKEILNEFAEHHEQGDARSLKILVSGHTDDKAVKTKSTAARHHDNMGLAAHRALTVERALKQSGIGENRMGISGYGQHQPVEPNTNEQARQKNRRVEIFVLAPDSPIAFEPADLQ